LALSGTGSHVNGGGAHDLITQVAQTAVANRHHSVDQQLCCRLLPSQERMDKSETVQPFPAQRAMDCGGATAGLTRRRACP
jgi:hypothetical protein